jgi:hypothetical protein
MTAFWVSEAFLLLAPELNTELKTDLNNELDTEIEVEFAKVGVICWLLIDSEDVA